MCRVSFKGFLCPRDGNTRQKKQNSHESVGCKHLFKTF